MPFQKMFYTKVIMLNAGQMGRGGVHLGGLLDTHGCVRIVLVLSMLFLHFGGEGKYERRSCEFFFSFFYK